MINPQIYREAAERIKEYGWYHGETNTDNEGPNLKTCAAMSIVDAGGHGSVLESFARFIGWSPRNTSSYYVFITEWNDAQPSAEVVTAKLREFASTLDQLGAFDTPYTDAQMVREPFSNKYPESLNT